MNYSNLNRILEESQEEGRPQKKRWLTREMVDPNLYENDLKELCQISMEQDKREMEHKALSLNF